MIQENIAQKFHSLGVLLLLDSPAGLQFGIDNISWKTGNKFKGLKLIPLGTHIITYSLQSQNHMFKIANFLIFDNLQRILIRRWNEQVSQFVEVRGEEAEGYANGVKHFHFDSYLGPYPQENLVFWNDTTKYITKPVLDKLDPIDKLHQISQQYSNNNKKKDENNEQLCIDEQQNEDDLIAEEDDDEKEDEENKQEQNPGKFKALPDNIYYSNIPRYLRANPELITKINLDKTPILKNIVATQWKNKQQLLLGEIQYSFVHFIIGQNQQSLTQWKKLINLLTFSQSAYFSVQEQSKQINLQKLIMDFIPVLYNQLNQFPIDFFRDQISKNSFLCQIMKRFHQYQNGPQYSTKIKKRIKKLMEMVKTKFNFFVDSSDEEDEKPAVLLEQESYF